VETFLVHNFALEVHGSEGIHLTGGGDEKKTQESGDTKELAVRRYRRFNNKSSREQ